MPYPNEWLEDGKILTWYIRPKDWDGGNSDTAKLLLGHAGDSGDDSKPSGSSVVLFTRLGTGEFVCCGTCMASAAAADSSGSGASNKKLVKLNVHLKDWETMKDKAAFTQLLEAQKAKKGPKHKKDGSDPVTFRKRLAQTVVDGNIVGALGMALDNSRCASTDRSISNGMICVKNILANSDDPLVVRAMEIVESMV